MQNIEVMPNPAQDREPDTDNLSTAEIQGFDWLSSLPVPENRKFKVAVAGSAVKAGEVCDTDYYYG